jgi:acetyltransferase-like isoleucine patch superfamily enzyme
MRKLFKDILYYFINFFLNKIPSRFIRKLLYYSISRGNISFRANIALGVKILDITNVIIGEHTNINSGCIIDGRGKGVEISTNVDIAPQVNIWSLEHDPHHPSYLARSGKVIIHKNVWIANRAIVLPGTVIGEMAVIGAGCVVSKSCEAYSIYVGAKQKMINNRSSSVKEYKLSPIRRFR